MPISYRILPEKNLVMTRAHGVLREDELLAHKRTLLADPEFRPGMRELSDVRDVEKLDVSPAGIRSFVIQDEADAPKLEGYRLAIVASEDLVYGMARMYEMQAETLPPSVRVFRDLAEAEAWIEES